jgi:uncharacterized protein (TIGR04141 family)
MTEYNVIYSCFAMASAIETRCSVSVQKLSIRLIRKGIEPKQVVRKGVKLKSWSNIPGSLIVLGGNKNDSPKWASFLELDQTEIAQLYTRYVYAIIFVKTNDRWFTLSFGMGHAKLILHLFEPDFGLKVVLNRVNPNELKSTDVRTPDENTLSKRSQTVRGSDQTAFGIDIERDIVRGIAGTPNDLDFAIRVSGSDALSIDKEITVDGIVDLCNLVLKAYNDTKYKKHFKWIDKIRYIRDDDIIHTLDSDLISSLQKLLEGKHIDNIHLAYPVIYDPDKLNYIRFKGFRSRMIHNELSIENYISALKHYSVNKLELIHLDKHEVVEVDDSLNRVGNSWRIRDCLSFETEIDGEIYVLSGGQWYNIITDFAKQIREYFNNTEYYTLPDALIDENEEKYNDRISKSEKTMICLDRKLIYPTSSPTPIEICDFLSLDNRLIHVKHKSTSARLSHLFNQGFVSATIMVTDPEVRDEIISKIQEAEKEFGMTGFAKLIPTSSDQFRSNKYTVVFGVIGSSKNPRLPFFSLVTFRQASRAVLSLGYGCEFCWIKQPRTASSKLIKRK